MISNQTEQVYEKFSHPRRLHPTAIIFALFTTIKEMIFGIGIGLIFTLKESVFFFLIVGGIFLACIIIFSILSWLRFTYYVEDDELRIEQGILNRKKRYISINRIHKIDLTANVIHRLFRLVKVQIDTASNSGDAEVSLSAIRMDDATELRMLLQHNKEQEETDNTIKAEQSSESISWKRLFIAGSTSGSAGVIVIALLTVFSQIEELIPRYLFNVAYDWLINIGVYALAILLLLIAILFWIFGIAGTMIRYGNFTIEKREKELFIRRGLLETKELTIPYDRIQAIGIEQSPIRQPFGFVTVFAVVAGGSFDRLETFPILFPIIHKSEVEEFINKFVPNYDYSLKKQLKPLPRRSLIFYIAKSFIAPLFVLVASLIFIPTLYWLALVVLIFNLILSMFQYKDLGHYISDENFVLQKRTLQKVTLFTEKKRIQAFEKRVHKIQAFRQVASVTISLIGMQGLGTHYTLKHVRDEDANLMADSFSYRKEKQKEGSLGKVDYNELSDPL